MVEPFSKTTWRREALVALVFWAGAATLASAQQTGDSNRNLSINGIGLGTASGASSTLIPLPGVMDVEYRTLDAYAPIIFGRSGGLWTAAQVGFTVTPTNSLDVDLATAEVLLDGTQGGFSSLYLRTDSTGSFSISGAIPQMPTSPFHGYVMGHVAPTSPDSWWVSQVVTCRFVNCAAQTSPLPAGDDTTHQVFLNNGLVFYGQAYTSVYVNSNGNITFGAGDTAYLETIPDMLSGPPRIAALWDDLNPQSGGSVTLTQFPASQDLLVFEACWQDVPEFPNSGSHSFLVRFYQPTAPGLQPRVQIFYGGISTQDAIVGVSPGGNILNTWVPLDLSGVAASFVPGQAAMEVFDSSNPVDLEARRVIFLLDSQGFPTGTF